MRPRPARNALGGAAEGRMRKARATGVEKMTAAKDTPEDEGANRAWSAHLLSLAAGSAIAKGS
ncbi:hypothetical protein [Streptomyces sp. NBC_01602]|uniref:hypothetical protein n=1 Tax=Streptomyces sp. NBC_01602 TaxID=2975893 RepID=UPI00386574A3|nr:hypothetical protein OG955_00495 [Streptomyces sp. NBC_01602]